MPTPARFAAALRATLLDDEPYAPDPAVAAGDDPDASPETAGPRPLTNLGAARVLILNASYEPLHVCSVKRAITLLMHDLAERVQDGDRVLRSPSAVVPVPSVIRLRRYVRRPHRQRVAFNRKNVFRRDDHTCQYCGVRSHDLTLDHVQPRSRGGPTTWENVVACCRRCNATKRDRTPVEAGMALRRRPSAPAFLFSSAYGVLPDLDPAWEAYLPRGR
ncbi:MAG: HNH endonuclease [Trueperaceae bacterium]|nr:HNH endonuclease [Trueperaceae bacterium]